MLALQRDKRVFEISRNDGDGYRSSEAIKQILVAQRLSGKTHTVMNSLIRYVFLSEYLKFFFKLYILETLIGYEESETFWPPY